MMITELMLVQGMYLDKEVWVYALDMGDLTKEAVRHLPPTEGLTLNTGADRVFLVGKKGNLLKSHTLIWRHHRPSLIMFDNEAECVAHYRKRLYAITEEIEERQVEVNNHMNDCIQRYRNEVHSYNG